MSIRLENAMAATQGGRKYQEDTALVWDDRGVRDVAQSVINGAMPIGDGQLLAVLGDGMGGHVGGATASRLAAEAFVAGFADETRAISDRLLASLEVANRSLADKVAARPMFQGMGTTLIGAIVEGAELSWVSVGDSALYLWRRGELARLNEDHSMAPEIDKLAAAGKISAAAAASDPRRHYLRAAVTGEEIELIDVALKPLDLADGDLVLLASDGIHTFGDDEIAAVIGTHIDGGAAGVAAALVRAIDDAGVHHQDNTTVIAITVAIAADSTG